jgi:hypothetical protein
MSGTSFNCMEGRRAIAGSGAGGHQNYGDDSGKGIRMRHGVKGWCDSPVGFAAILPAR